MGELTRWMAFREPNLPGAEEHYVLADSWFHAKCLLQRVDSLKQQQYEIVRAPETTHVVLFTIAQPVRANSAKEQQELVDKLKTELASRWTILGTPHVVPFELANSMEIDAE